MRVSILLFILTVFSCAAYAQRLGPAKVIDLTLSNNGQIKLALLDLLIAKAELAAADNDFGTNLTLTPSYTLDRLLSNSTLKSLVTTEKNRALSLAVTQKLVWGTNLELTMQLLNIRTDDITTTSKNRDQMASQIKLTQPLLKGGGTSYNDERARASQAKVKRYYAKLEEAINKQLFTSIKAYWELYKVTQQIKIKKMSLRQAELTVDYDDKLWKLGKRSEIKYLSSKAQVAVIIAKIKNLETKLIDKEAKLKRQILSPPSSDVEVKFTLEELSKSEKSKLRNFKISQKVIDQSDGMGPQLRVLEMEIEEKESAVASKKNALMPKIDLTLEYLTSSLGTTRNQVFQDTLNRKYPSWEFALNFSWSFGNNVAQGAFSKALAAKNRKIVERKREGLSTKMKVKNIIGEIREKKSNLTGLVSHIKTEKEKVNMKRMFYRLGRINNRELLRATRDYQDVLARESEEYASLSQSIAHMQQLLNILAGEVKKKYLANLAR